MPAKKKTPKKAAPGKPPAPKTAPKAAAPKKVPANKKEERSYTGTPKVNAPPRRPDRLLFGTGGTPHTAGPRDHPTAVRRLHELGLGVYEMEFVHGVRIRPETCEERVAMRVLQGGHDVPTEKVVARFPHTLANLARAISELPHVLVFDNTDLAHPYRKVAEFEGGHPITLSPALPAWLRWD